MIIDDPLFPQPQEDFCIIRYMDLFKYEHLLRTASLYFTRADHLKKQDSFEGSMTKENFKFFTKGICGNDFYRSMFNFRDPISRRKIIPVEFGRTKITGDRNLDLRNIRKEFQKDYEFLKQGLFVNCWCIGDHELYTMWKSYTENAAGIAIRSTFYKLKETLDNSDVIVAGKIKYLNFDAISSNIPKPVPIFFKGGTVAVLKDMLFTKTKYYETERELRLIYSDADFFNQFQLPDIDLTKNNKDLFKLSKIKLDDFIDNVILHPGATGEFYEKVRTISLSCDIPIAKIVFSALDTKPYSVNE